MQSPSSDALLDTLHGELNFAHYPALKGRLELQHIAPLPQRLDGLVQLRRPDMDPSEAAALQCMPASPVSDHDLAEAAHFSHYAFAAYGYMLYVFSKPE